MSRRGNTFIDLEDILGFGLECPDCHCAVTIPYSVIYPPPERGGDIRNVPPRCPNCQREWHTTESPTAIKQAIENFAQSLTSIQRSTSQVKLAFSLEIAEEESGAESEEQPGKKSVAA